MNLKWIEEHFQRYMIFGVHPEHDRVDVCDSDGTIVSCTRAEAERLIKDRDRLIDALISAIGQHGESAWDVYDSLLPEKCSDFSKSEQR